MDAARCGRRRPPRSSRARARCETTERAFLCYRTSWCGSSGCDWQQIAENKTVALDDVAGAHGNGFAEDGAIEDEGVKLAVFAAGVDSRRQLAKEGGVELPPGEAVVEFAGIDADGDGTEAGREKVGGKFARIAF